MAVLPIYGEGAATGLRDIGHLYIIYPPPCQGDAAGDIWLEEIGGGGCGGSLEPTAQLTEE